MFNKVILIGNLTRDIELKYLPTGMAVASSAIATSRKFNASNGEKKEEVCFIDITFFGRVAEVANQYLSKGRQIMVEGRLKFDQWQDQNGQNRSKHSVIVENMQMLGSPRDQGQSQQNYNQNYTSQNQGYSTNRQESKSYNPYENTQNKPENIPEIDLDSDKYDNGSNFDEDNGEIPF